MELIAESIYDYELSDIEYEVLITDNIDRSSYYRDTSQLKRLSDLHLLFLIRRDKENAERILNLIRNMSESLVEIDQRG